ncbi:MAG: hypothetical protein AB1846_03275 [Chloroflexota bacterium]
MLSKKENLPRWGIALAAVILVTLACGIPTAAPAQPQAPAFDATKAVLEIQSTQMALQLTQQAVNNAQQVQPTPQPPTAQPPTQQPPTAEPLQPTAVPPTPTQDIAGRIRNAKILVYEDAASANLANWVKATLNMMGVSYTHDGDAIGNFMAHLNSGTQWDLIIVAAESRSGVQGEFWDVITPKVVNDETALIAEMWYLSDTVNGRIRSLVSKCGIDFQKVRKYVDSIYTLDTSHPVFTTPNNGFGLTHYVGYWTDKGGDYIELTGSGDAKLLAGGHPNEKSSYGLVASCIEGRVIFQTFSDHDYHQADIMALWENYITYVLTNRFNAVP